MAEDEQLEDVATPTAPSRKPTPAERIEELNDVDKSISDILGLASTAITILANTSTTRRPSLESQKTAFSEAINTYFSKLSEMEVRLRRNVYALQEAGLIQEGDKLRDGARGVAAANNNESRSGGNGPLDSSWLNARSSDSISNSVNEEIWADARKFVDRLEAKKGGELAVGEDMAIDPKDG